MKCFSALKLRDQFSNRSTFRIDLELLLNHSKGLVYWFLRPHEIHKVLDLKIESQHLEATPRDSSL